MAVFRGRHSRGLPPMYGYEIALLVKALRALAYGARALSRIAWKLSERLETYSERG